MDKIDAEILLAMLFFFGTPFLLIYSKKFRHMFLVALIIAAFYGLLCFDRMCLTTPLDKSSFPVPSPSINATIIGKHGNDWTGYTVAYKTPQGCTGQENVSYDLYCGASVGQQYALRYSMVTTMGSSHNQLTALDRIDSNASR
jgi:hypothetical protein